MSTTPNSETPAPPRRRRPPSIRQYLGLVAVVWTYLGIQAWILSELLASSRAMYLFSGLLGLGFLAVALFDCVWMNFFDHQPSDDDATREEASTPGGPVADDLQGSKR